MSRYAPESEEVLQGIVDSTRLATFHELHCRREAKRGRRTPSLADSRALLREKIDERAAEYASKQEESQEPEEDDEENFELSDQENAIILMQRRKKGQDLEADLSEDELSLIYLIRRNNAESARQQDTAPSPVSTAEYNESDPLHTVLNFF